VTGTGSTSEVKLFRPLAHAPFSLPAIPAGAFGLPAKGNGSSLGMAAKKAHIDTGSSLNYLLNSEAPRDPDSSLLS
jgi:hypothetical protein